MALKGHAKIELTNVNTGEVEVVEHDNMITNGILKVLNKRGNFESAVCNENCIDKPLNCVVSNWFKGLMIFSHPLNEDPDDFSFPADNSCTGYGSVVANSGINSLLGSYNETESEFNLEARTAKYVWDFSTNQGNGQISSLALVPTEVSKMGWENKMEESIYNVYSSKNFTLREFYSQNDGADCFLYYDDTYIWGIEKGNLVYNSSATSNHLYNTRTLRFIKKKMSTFTNKVSIFARGQLWAKDFEEVIEVPLPSEMNSILDAMTGSNRAKNICMHLEYDNGFYYFYLNSKSDILLGEAMHFLKINADDFTSSLVKVVNLTDHVLYSSNTYSRGSQFNSHVWQSYSGMRIVNGKLIAYSYNSKAWWIIDMADNTNVKKVAFSNGDSYISATQITGLKYKGYLFMGQDSGSTSASGLYALNIEKGLMFRLYLNQLYNPFAQRHWVSSAYTSEYYHYNTIVKGKDDDMPHICIYPDSSSVDELSVRIYFNPLILMTKNNLDTPVIKTSAQTMKVTYTITEEIT